MADSTVRFAMKVPSSSGRMITEGIWAPTALRDSVKVVKKEKRSVLERGTAKVCGAELNGEQRIAVTVSQKDVMPVLEGYNADVAQRYHCKLPPSARGEPVRLCFFAPVMDTRRSLPV